MPPKKKKRIKDNEGRLEQLGIYEDEEEYDSEEQDEKEAWRDVG
jgi:hypothetical protein